MSIENFFRHTCDIYHATYTGKTAKYGLPSSEKNLSYPNEPSIADAACFFGFSNAYGAITEAEPMNVFSGANELSLPAGTVIHQGDKVVDKRFNLEYTVGFPEDIRGKYVVAPIYRRTAQEAL